MDLAAVIVNYHSLDALRECLPALGSGDAGPREIIVVDNEAEDATARAIEREFPAVRLIANPDNRGYSRAVNQGIAASTARYVAVMNPDLVAEPGALATLVRWMDEHPRCGVCGPRLVGPDGVVEFSARTFPSHLTFLFNRYSLLTRLFPRNRWSWRYLLSDWDHASTRDVDWLAGACLVVRREAIDQVGGMDEAFFMFNEDVDWCRRMNQGGWKVTYVPAATVMHHVGASRRKVSAKVIIERHRGMIHYFHKYHPTNPLIAGVADAAIMLRAGLMLAQNALRSR